jgi:UDP-glucuronate 4-epimerase
MQPGDVAATEADVTLLERDLQWKPSTTLDVGIARFVAWFKDYHGGAPA